MVLNPSTHALDRSGLPGLLRHPHQTVATEPLETTLGLPQQVLRHVVQ